jgi:endo-1,4-beta-xylanase
MRATPNWTAALLSLTLGLLAGCGPQVGEADLASTEASATLTTLRAAAEAAGRSFGVSIQASKLSDSVYASIASREFDEVTPENELKTLEPTAGSFNYSSADTVYNWASQHGLRVHGHTLLWSVGLPSYLGSYDQTKMRAYITNYIGTVMAHYQGKLAYWDVVSEAFYDTGTARYAIFKTAGDDWIELGFRTARAADSSAKLCYTDYNIEDWSSAKTQAVYAMVKDFKSRGVPIDCVGFESHFTGGATLPSSFQTTLSKFVELGVEVALTELDVTSANATVYAGAVNACLAVKGCTGITVWGVRDNDSWRSSESPLLFDSSGQKKSAYTAVLNALNAAVPPLLCSGSGSSGVDCITPAAPANLAWTNDGGTVTLTWTASTSNVGITYDLYFGSFSLGSFGDTRVDLIGFKPGTPYVFTVKARDATGLVSVASSPVTVLLPVLTDTTPPSVPTNLELSSYTYTTITFKWTASTDDVGVVAYQVFNGTSQIGTILSTTATLYFDSSMPTPTITVRALDAAGNVSAASKPLSLVITSCALGCTGKSSGD